MPGSHAAAISLPFRSTFRHFTALTFTALSDGLRSVLGPPRTDLRLVANYLQHVVAGLGAGLFIPRVRRGALCCGAHHRFHA